MKVLSIIDIIYKKIVLKKTKKGVNRMYEEIFNIQEVDYFNANKLLKTNCFKLLDTCKKVLDYDTGSEKIVYSLGQFIKGECEECRKKEPEKHHSTITYTFEDSGRGTMCVKGKCGICKNEIFL
ncbi:hypothetical protein RBH29_17060 [Herbivorax sp. ANBcel31]|uniref:hypothetical protein n=1 Tax=Herbivorax sp. ANBcel31 TaxID=3069754 RepID=UPI0027B76F17|nr:hypothetical protein [Herbivorax sp. ANBcel31]MDQ2088137.1 hypothetical protein [Herbivorax sp. ANBcel31]